MTQEEKQLLLKDICARLPYGLKGNFKGEVVDIESVSRSIVLGVLVSRVYIVKEQFTDRTSVESLDNVKPYLRPMSSMTDEEEVLFRCELPAIAKTDAQLVAMRMELFLKGHLDFNHLIEKGLALEAPEDMYKTE